MRLAVVSPFVDRRHGTERALAELLERLASIYHCEIHLYAQRVEGLPIDPPGARASGKEDGILWHKVPSIPGPPLLQFLSWLFLNSFFRSWDRLVRRLQFDLVLSPGLNCFDADIIIVHALFHRLKELAFAEEGAPTSSLLRRFHRRAYYSMLAWLERRIYSSSKVSLAAVSWRTASFLSRYSLRHDVRVIPNGVDATEFSPEKRLALRAGTRSRYHFADADCVLLLIGNDWRNKGLSTILEAMAACRDIPLRLLVAGQDQAAPFLLEAAKSLGLGEKCRLETTPMDAIHLYAASDAYVSPTREDAFALPPLEAMSCGLPVITSMHNGGSQIITENVDGFVLKDPWDASKLAGFLRGLQKQSDLRLRIGASARRTALQYSWDRNARAVWEWLQRTLANELSQKR